MNSEARDSDSERPQLPARKETRRPPPFTNLQGIIDDLNRAVQHQVSCVHDVLRPGTSEGAVILGVLECARCGMIQEARRRGPTRGETQQDL